MNFQTVLEELDRLYKEDVARKIVDEEGPEAPENEETSNKPEDDKGDAPINEGILDKVVDKAVAALTESDEEEQEPEEVRLVLECANCGTIVVKPERDVTVNEESDLANENEPCQYCEESNGYAVLGVLTPYVVDIVDDAAEVEEAAEETPEEEAEAEVEEELEEGIFSKKPSHVLIAKSDDGSWYSIVAGSDINKLKAREKEAHASYVKHGVDTATKIVDYKTAQKMTGEKDPSSQENLDK